MQLATILALLAASIKLIASLADLIAEQVLIVSAIQVSMTMEFQMRV